MQACLQLFLPRSRCWLLDRQKVSCHTLAWTVCLCSAYAQSARWQACKGLTAAIEYCRLESAAVATEAQWPSGSGCSTRRSS